MKMIVRSVNSGKGLKGLKENLGPEICVSQICFLI